MIDADWNTLSIEEKRERRFADWLDTGAIEFESLVAQANYQARITRLARAIRHEIPDRVPVTLPAEGFPAYHAGLDFRTVMYDYDKLADAWRSFYREFDSDTLTAPMIVYSGKVLEMVDYRLYAWPGHGLPANAPFYQFVEGEYMMADEYEHFLRDPSDYVLRVFIPRAVGKMDAFRFFPPLTAMAGRPQNLLFTLGNPEVRTMLRNLDTAKEETKRGFLDRFWRRS